MLTASADAGPSAGDHAAPAGAEPDQAPYAHDPAAVPAAAALVDAAYAASARWWDVTDNLRARAASADLEAEAPLLRELLLAVSYELRLAHGGPAGCELRPRTVAGEFAWPPRIADVRAGVVALWRDIASAAEHPAARARFSDLLFERRDGAARDRAVTAGTAYLAAAQSRSEADLEVAAFLIRAWELARRTSSWTLLGQACQELMDRADAAMSGGRAMPGAVLPMIAALAAKPVRGQSRQAPETIPDPAQVGALLDTAFRAFPESYLATQIASMMRGQATDPAQAEAISRREVGAYLAEAAASTGLARQTHLEGAIRIARDRGLTDLARQATAELQAIPVKDLGLRRSSSTIRVPHDHVERYLDAFTASTRWQDGLGFFLRTDCPIGSLDVLRQQERDIAQVTVFVSTIARTILGRDGLPRWTAASEADRQAERLAFHARVRAETQGRDLAEGLQRFAGRYGTPAESELAAFLSGNGQADQALALSLARGLRHFWSGDFEACVCVVVPKVEAAARALLRELDEGIYRTQVAREPGQYPGLYVLLQELERLALDESWAYFLRWLLLGPLGMNIRNEIAHGFVSDISPVYAALALRAAALLITLVAPQPQSAASSAARQDDDPSDLAELPDRDREDILLALSRPVQHPVPSPGRDGSAGRLAALTASTLRITAAALRQAAGRLDP
jgi:Domain of unknown function (DUF4209)